MNPKPMALSANANRNIQSPTPSTQVEAEIPRWEGQALAATRIALLDRRVLDCQAGMKPALVFVSVGDAVSTWFMASDLQRFLAVHHKMSFAVYDLTGLRRRLRETGAGEAVAGLDAAVAGQRVTDLLILHGLHKISRGEDAQSEAPSLTRLLALHAGGDDSGRQTGAHPSGSGQALFSLSSTSRRHLLAAMHGEGVRLLRVVATLGQGLTAEATDLLPGALACHGPGTHDLQARAACVLADMTDRGVAFCRQRHTALKLKAWANLARSVQALADAYPDLLRSPAVPDARNEVEHILWVSRAAHHIGSQLCDAGMGDAGFHIQDIRGRILREAATVSHCAGLCLHVRDALQAYNLVEPGVLVTRGRIYPTYYPMAATGRVSTREPNVQGFSRESGIRECLTAGEDQLLLSFDYGGMELGPLAAECERLGWGTQMADALRQGLDLHVVVASHVQGVPYEEFRAWRESNPQAYHEGRQCAKALNFGLAAGMGSQRLAETIGEATGWRLTPEEAADIIDGHRGLFPDLAAFVDAHRDATDQAGAGGMLIALPTGRTRRCRDYRTALNTRSQGLGADVALTALCRLVDAGFTPVIFVHDEIVLEVARDEVATVAEAAAGIMRQAMADVLQTSIPCVVKAVAGPSWGSLSQL